MRAWDWAGPLGRAGGRLHELVVGNDLAGDAEAVGLVALDAVAGVLEQQGVAYANEPGKLPAVPTKPIPRWDMHFWVLKTTERTPQDLISPFSSNWVPTDSVVWRYVHFTLALV